MVSPAVRRGEVYRVRHPQHGDPKKSRCFVVVSRQELLDSNANRVLCVPVNTLGVGSRPKSVSASRRIEAPVRRQL